MGLPVGLERAYGLFTKRLVGQVHNVGIAASSYYHSTLRHLQDQEDPETGEELEEPEDVAPSVLIAALAAMGISFSTLINEVQLRNALRRIARSNDIQVKRQLAGALGRPVNANVEAEVSAWVDVQVERIQKFVEKWEKGVSSQLQTPPEDLDFEQIVLGLAEKKTEAERKSFAAAAAGLLLLNSALVAANSQREGIETYIWRTSLDDRVRDHHADLEGTVQRWDSPPAGGGTSDGEAGHPGYGINCRCVAEVIVTL